VYTTDDDDVYVGQSVMNVGWKDIETLGGQEPSL
jgi:hypothetical protein